MSDYWTRGWRAAQLAALSATPSRWDLVVVGGGITGAGILLEARRRGLKVLLVEQKDFAWGTSSRSSKLVHGGLRYLASGQIGLTRDAVRERERLLAQAPGLVDELDFLMLHEPGQFPRPWQFNLLLRVYDWFAGRRTHRRVARCEQAFVAPGVPQPMAGISQYTDAITDDARLVLRVLHEALAEGALALNYVRASQVVRQGDLSRLSLRDELSGQTLELVSKVVVNATGAWAAGLCQSQATPVTIRPLRGSHLVIPAWRLPVATAVSFFHQQDQRPVFVIPWEGMTLLGTTDLDHQHPLQDEPAISQEEVDYLLQAVNHAFPGLGLEEQDVLASFSGVRPVVSSGSARPSDEKREHSVWVDQGTISVAGGKITTFRLIARDVLAAAGRYLPVQQPDKRGAIFSPVRGDPARWQRDTGLSAAQLARLVGRYGNFSQAIVARIAQEGVRAVVGTQVLWAELEWILAHETVVHLDDLLLRRTRLGLMLAKGAAEIFDELGALCGALLAWDASRWQIEVDRYRQIIAKHYSLPKRALSEVVCA